jgi:hypothetical protein
MNKINEQEILTFWSKEGYTLECPRTGGKSRKIKTKKQKGGMLKSDTLQDLLNAFNCFKPNQIYPENVENPGTKFSDIPRDIQLNILKESMDQYQTVKELFNKLSLVNKDFNDIKQNLLASNDIRDVKIEYSWQIYQEKSNIFSNFIEYIITNCKDIINNTANEPSNGPLEILFTQDYKFTNNDGEKTYKIVVKKIIFQKHTTNSNRINMRIELGNYDNLEYIDNNQQDTTTIVLKKPEYNYSPLVESIIDNNNNRNILFSEKIRVFNKDFTNIAGKNIDINPDQSIFGRVYDCLLQDKIYVHDYEIDDIINNNFYIKFPRIGLFQKIGKAFTVFLQIKKELTIDKDYILEKLRENRQLNILFTQTKDMEDAIKKQEAAISASLQATPTAPEASPQAELSNFDNLFDVYFTKSDIDDINLYLMKLMKLLKTKISDEDITKLVTEILPKVIIEKLQKIHTFPRENQEIQKNNIINSINAETRKDTPEDIWKIFT